jgi:hypothetical protein
MPLARGVPVQVVHIFCSPGGLASQRLRKKANQRDEAVDAESHEATTMMYIHHMLTTTISRYILLSLSRRLDTVLWITRGPTRSLVGH